MDKLKSRKFWITVVSMAFVVIGAVDGFLNSGQAITSGTVIALVYTVVQGLIDKAQVNG